MKSLAASPRPIGSATVAWLTAGLGLATVPFVTSLPPWLVPALLVLAVWRWRRERRGAPPVPTYMSLAVIAPLIGLLALTGNIGLGLEAALPLFVCFLWVKLLELRNERDVLMTAFFGCFLAAGALLTAQGFGPALYSVAVVAVLIAAMLRYHIGASPGRRVLAPLRPAALLVLQALPIAGVLFLFVPRPQTTINFNPGQASSGVSDRMDPSDIAKLALDERIAFRAEFAAEPPSPTELYWRGLTLSKCDGLNWQRGREGNPDKLRTRQVPGASERPFQVDISLLPTQQAWLYSLDCPTSLPEGASSWPGLVLKPESPVRQPVSYRLTADLGRSAADDNLYYLNSTALETPKEVDPRVLALADGWRLGSLVDGRADSERIVTSAIAHFHDGGYTYTLEPGIVVGDPVAGFLFESKRGFCGHYAGAFALLMRLAGVPARIVLGYRGGEQNAIGGFIAVRQSHAHAWCEVWSEREHRWQRVDPTQAVAGGDPTAIASQGAQALVEAHGSGREPGAWTRGMRQARQWYDYGSLRWDVFMYSYDRKAQLGLLRRLGLAGLGEWGLLIALVVGVGAVVLALTLFLRRRRRVGDPARRLYDRWCARLARAGLARADGEAPLAFAQRAAAALPQRGPAIAAVTAAYVAARYGRPDEHALRRLRRAVNAAR